MGLGTMYEGMLWETSCPVPLLCPMVVQRRTRAMYNKEVRIQTPPPRCVTAVQIHDLPPGYFTDTQFALGVVYMKTAGDACGGAIRTDASGQIARSGARSQGSCTWLFWTRAPC